MTTIPTTLTPELAQMLGELVELSIKPSRSVLFPSHEKRRAQDARLLGFKIKSILDGQARSPYSKPVDKIGNLMTVAEFKEHVLCGMLSDDDGFGHPAKDGMMDEDITIHPEDAHIPPDATHVVWYNK